MARICVFCCIAFLAIATSLRASDDTIAAGKILKSWESAAIDNAAFRFKQTTKRLIEPKDDPDGPPIRPPAKLLIQTGHFQRAKSIGMKCVWEGGEFHASNVLRAKGIYVHKSGPLFSTTINLKGKTEIESQALTSCLIMWLDPASRHTGTWLRANREKALSIERKEKEKGRITIVHDERTVTLAEEYGWRIIEEKRTRDERPFTHLSFEYVRFADGVLGLKSCKKINYELATGAVSMESTIEISDVKLDLVKEENLILEIPAPSLVYDCRIDPARNYILRPDRSEVPLTSEEHQKLLDELDAEKKNTKRA